MRARTLIVAVVGCLLFAGPASAQGDPPAPLFDAAPLQDAGAATPTDGGRSTLLLVLALAGVAGAGVMAGLALRPVAPRAAAAEAAPSARRAMPPIEEPPAPPAKEAWRPRVVSELPPLPAFGSGPEPPTAP